MSDSFCGIQLISTLDRTLFGNTESSLSLSLYLSWQPCKHSWTSADAHAWKEICQLHASAFNWR